MGSKIHISRIAFYQPPEEHLFFLRGIPICHNHRLLGCHRTLHMMGLPLHDAEKCLLNRNGALQHCFHNGIIPTILDAADIQHTVAGCNQRIHAGGIIPDHTPARCFGPAPKASYTIRNVNADRSIHFTSFSSGIRIGKLQSLKINFIFHTTPFWFPFYYSRIHALLKCIL